MRYCYFFLGLLLALISCDVDYEDNKRLLFTGVVVDENQRPISDIPIEVFVSFSFGLFAGTGEELLGEAMTDENGSFRLVALSPRGSRTISAEINKRFQVGHKPEYATFSFIGLETIETPDATVKLSDVKVERIVNSRFTIRRSNNTTDTIYYGIKASPIEKIRYVNASLDPGFSPGFFTVRDSLLSSENEATLELGPLLAKDTLDFEYRLSSAPNAEVISQKLVYNPETDSYVFEL